MKKKTSEPKPMSVIEYEDSNLEIFLLDEGDRMAWNSSTNYDHHLSGPSLVFKSGVGGRNIQEHYVNSFEAWHYIDKMIQLGKKFIDQNPDFDIRKFDEELMKRRAEYKPHVSMHKGTEIGS